MIIIGIIIQSLSLVTHIKVNKVSHMIIKIAKQRHYFPNEYARRPYNTHLNILSFQKKNLFIIHNGNKPKIQNLMKYTRPQMSVYIKKNLSLEYIRMEYT